MPLKKNYYSVIVLHRFGGEKNNNFFENPRPNPWPVVANAFIVVRGIILQFGPGNASATVAILTRLLKPTKLICRRGPIIL